MLRTTCGSCGTSLLVDTSHTSAALRGVNKAIAPTPWKINLFQWTYAAGSLTAFWLLSDKLNAVPLMVALQSHGLLAFFIAFFIFVTTLIVPREILLAVIRRTSVLIKLGFVFNLLTAAIVLELLILTWWARFIGVALLFVSVWLGVIVCWKVLWPLVGAISQYTVTQRTFDPRAGQGRRVKQE